MRYNFGNMQVFEFLSGWGLICWICGKHAGMSMWNISILGGILLYESCPIF